MKVQTYSIIAGSEACNAECPYCVSKMTPNFDIEAKEPEVNWRNFNIATKAAEQYGAKTVLITGKGEPTLFPEQITKYMKVLEGYSFPFKEIQTNGIVIFDKYETYVNHLKNWYGSGMTTIAISIVHYNSEKNRSVFMPHRKKYMDLADLIDKLHNLESPKRGFSVRLSCTMFKGYIDDIPEIKKLVDFAKENEVEQLTLRPVEKPAKSRNPKIAEWVAEHKLDEDRMNEIKQFFKKEGKELRRLVHGAIIYDLYEQNVCLTNALTIDSTDEEIRQLIFFPDGHLRYDWQYPGAILI